MIKILEKEKAKKIWDSNLLNLSNPTYYQSYNYSEICKGNTNVEYIYQTDELGKMNIMSFIKIDEDKISIPFGPIFSSNCNFLEVMSFIDNIKRYYNKKVLFSLPKEFVDDVLIQEFNLTKGWCFTTPLIDTNKTIDEIVKNCNKNRRRIIKNVLQNIPIENIKTDAKYVEQFLELYKRRMIETEGELDLSIDMLNKMLEYNNTKLTVCLNDEELMAGSITFEFGDTLITRYNCYNSNYFKLSPIARVDYELLKYAANNPNIKYLDMSGLAVGDNITNKENNLNRYKLSYRPKKVLTYQWYKQN